MLSGSRRCRRVTSLFDAVSLERRPLETLQRRHRSDGPVFELSSLVAGEMLVLGSPELAHEVLHAAPGRFLAGAANHRILPLLPSDTVLTLDGDAHVQRRQLLASLFHGDVLETLTPVIEMLTDEEAARWPTGRPLAMLPGLRFLSLRIAANAIFGIESRPEATVLERLVATALPAYGLLAGHPRLARLGPLSPEAVTRRRLGEFAGGLRQLLGRRRPPSVELVGAEQLFALLLAAHETTATALAWAIHELARAPEAAAAVLKSGRSDERPWLDAVIDETLRLRPPLLDIVRLTTDTVVLGGCEAKAGTLLLMPPPLIHRQAVDAPGTFRPQRFQTERPDPRGWIPFGGGDRRCLGASLALLQLRHALPVILRRFDVRPAETRAERAHLHGTALVPHRGARVTLTSRRPSP